MEDSVEKAVEFNDSLAEESDVVELTDEVAPKERAESSPKEKRPDADDLFNIEMPEFRVPTESGAHPSVHRQDLEANAQDDRSEPADGSSEEEWGHEFDSEADDESSLRDTMVETWKPSMAAAIPKEALDIGYIEAGEGEAQSEDGQATSGQGGSKQVEPAVVTDDIEHEVSDQPDEKKSSGVEQADDEIELDEVYDREDLVKTVRMEAIRREDVVDRKTLAAQSELEVGLLRDQRFAPEVLVAPPRLLLHRWHEGPVLEALSVEEEAESADFDETLVLIPDSEVEEIQELPVDILDDDDVAEGEPAPTRRGPPKFRKSQATPNLRKQKAPPAPEEGTANITKLPRKPTPHRGSNSVPRRASRVQSGNVQVEAKDSELEGLVQELVDEHNRPVESKPRKRGRSAQYEKLRREWFKTVFDEEYLRTLPRNILRQTVREVDFIEQSLDLPTGARILDLACGFGRHTLELARRGHDMVGLDLSMPLLQRALNEAQRQSLLIKFIHGDMRHLNFESVFDACFIWQASFGYFDDRSNFEVLQGIQRALSDDGRLLIDTLNRDYVVSELPARSWWEGQDCVFLEEVEFDHLSSVMHVKRSFIYENGALPLEHNAFIRLYSLHELNQLLDLAGFEIVDVSGELHHRGQFLGACSSRILLLAEKRSRA